MKSSAEEALAAVPQRGAAEARSGAAASSGAANDDVVPKQDSVEEDAADVESFQTGKTEALQVKGVLVIAIIGTFLCIFIF